MGTIIVTGVSRGLGLAISQRLVSDGHKVIGLSRSLSNPYKSLMDDQPGSAIFVDFDVSEIEMIPERSRRLIAEHKPIFGLVNNAGIGLDGVLATQHRSDIERIMATNLLGPILLTKHISRSMLARGQGRIVNVSSIIASTGFHGLSVYAATKAGLEGFTRSLSRELGKAGITVNCVAPGYMETDMTIGMRDDKMDAVRRRAPLGLARVEDAAAAVSYLLGTDATRITGTIVTVDGGSTA
ncbi:MAG: SDR family NAD(P)-dependent oxidoreductase [Pseudomonadota bacterium]